MTASPIVARFTFAAQAAESATLRTIASGQVHYSEEDAETGTYVVRATPARHRGLRTSTCIVLARDFVQDPDARVRVADLIFRLTHRDPEISPMALSAKVRAAVAEAGLR